jgi:hypothetical protein
MDSDNIIIHADGSVKVNGRMEQVLGQQLDAPAPYVSANNRPAVGSDMSLNQRVLIDALADQTAATVVSVKRIRGIPHADAMAAVENVFSEWLEQIALWRESEAGNVR